MRQNSRLLALVGVLALGLTGCAGASGGTQGPADSTGTTITIEDNAGTQEVRTPPQTIVALDNRTFELLSDWGVELAAAPVALMPTTNPYKTDESIVDIGNHREPKLELIAAAEPDLIITGQRFADYYDEIVALAPNATVIDLDPREGKPFDEELRRQVLTLGEIFGKTAEAEATIAEFDDAIQRVKDTYNGTDTIMSVNVSGGEIGYIAPSVGRTLGIVYDLFGFVPALQVDGASDDHQGDDISVEAIAAANPDWILVLDRDAATTAASEPGYQPAQQIIEQTEALQNVTAVQQGHVLYMPADTYTNEGIQTYTEFFNTLADALEKQ